MWGSFTDLDPLVAPGVRQAALARQIWPDLQENRDSLIARRSAIHWADQIRVPVLIMHGSDDEDMPIAHSQRMDAELTRLGIVHRFVAFEGQQHRIGGRGAERDAAAIDWFRRFSAN